MQLVYREFGAPTGGAVPVVLLHGLFGSAVNWQGIARRLAETHHVLAPDLRNHGRSPHGREMSYPAMAEDLRHLLARLGLPRVYLVGHSMGGKVAMWFALHWPESVAGLTVVDMAPVRYPNRFGGVLAALAGIDLEALGERRAADAALTAAVPAPEVRAFLLQNLERGPDGRWRWRVNLAALAAHAADLAGFPEPPASARYPGEALFLYGAASDYVHGRHEAVIRSRFPRARLRAVPGAGHWVYAEQPKAFLEALREVLPEPGV